MRYKNCTCTYFKLKERGYEPIDHAYNCPLSKGFYEKPLKRVIPPKGNNPFDEVNRSKLENTYAKTEEKSK